MKIHRIHSWVISYTNEPCDLVYDLRIAVQRFSRPNAIEMRLRVQARVCVFDRPDYDPVEDGTQCYMCSQAGA